MSERIDLTNAPLPPVRRPVSKNTGRGSGSQKLDEAARYVLSVGALIVGLLTLYCFGGLWSGAWSHETMTHLPQAARLRQVGNVQFVFHVLSPAVVVTLAALLICCARAEGVGYWLLGAAIFFYAGPPFATAQLYPLAHHTLGQPGVLALQGFQNLAWLFGIPGVIWTVVDIVRRLATAADKAAVQRANAKYGAGTKKQDATTQRQVFLGRCWEGPFCKDHIRKKCPIFLEKRGPCWRRKEGCMCEQRIVLQAMIAPDWKDQMTRADQARSLESGVRQILTPAAKRARCRICIIYNEHQRQKQKALTTAALVAVPSLFLLNLASLHDFVSMLLTLVDATAKRFSFSASPTGLGGLQSADYTLVIWVLVLTVAVVLLAQVLKLIDYVCFTLKI